jgi:hypothetical protein
MVPFICRRTNPTTAPYAGAVRNDFVKPVSTQTVSNVTPAFLTNQYTVGVFVAQDGVVPYALRTVGSSFTSGGGNTNDMAVGRESFPTTTATVDLGPYSTSGSGGPSAIEISWSYFDCSLATPDWTLVGSSSTMSISHTTAGGSNYWTGILAVPTLPSDYPQGSLRILQRQFVSGAWGAWQDGGVGMFSSIPLPVYPWNTQIPPWTESDADVTPVANAGWKDSVDRDHGPTITFTGTPTTVYSAGSVTFRHDAVTASAVGSKMIAAVSTLMNGMAKISDSSGILSFGGGQWTYYGKALVNPSGAGAYVLAIPNPSSTHSTTCIVDHAVIASPPAGNYIAVLGIMGGNFNRQMGAVSKLYQTTFVIP